MEKTEKGFACPACGGQDTRVKDSRAKEGKIRRRRRCATCSIRFTTWESIDRTNFLPQAHHRLAFAISVLPAAQRDILKHLILAMLATPAPRVIAGVDLGASPPSSELEGVESVFGSARNVATFLEGEGNGNQ